jgi:hypothetical protein
VIAREYLERFVHQSQIRRAVEAPDLSGELVAFVARVVVELLAAWLIDYAPPSGSIVGIDFGDAGAWSWQREAERWSVRDGIAGDAAARLSVAPEVAVALLSRGITADEATRRVTIEGDASLAAGVVDVALPLLGRPPA